MINRIFIGYDHRQPVSFTALSQSIINKTSKPVAITPLQLNTLPLERQGLTPFTFSRFLVPYLCNYEGWALFMDIDMIVLDDIDKIFSLADDRHTVLVSKNVQRFEWASMMLFNNARCKVLTPEYVEKASGLHTLDWCKEEEIGELPAEWNHLVGYDPERTDAKGVHYTQGVPAYPETIRSEYAQEWHDTVQSAVSTLPWDNLMATSVHAYEVDGVRLPKFLSTEEHKDFVTDLVKKKREALYGDITGNTGRHC